MSDATARTMRLHRIECTGPEGVTCVSCRDLGWMGWFDYCKHQAQALADAGLLATEAHDRAVAARAIREAADSLLPPPNIELRPDGSEDPEAARWIGFAHEVDDALRARADRIERDEQ